MKAGATDDLISELECGLINVALASRYSPDRWQNFLHVMILKNQGLQNYHPFKPFACSQLIAIMHLNTFAEK